MPKVLVTGGSGFIGSHTVCELLEKGYDVVSIDNFSSSEPFINHLIENIIHKSFHFFQADVCDEQQLNEVFEAHPDIDAVIHFAAFKSVPESVKHPIKYYQNNINGLTTLLKVCNKRGVRNIVFSSSCTVYGIPDVLPVTENQPLKSPLSPYGLTKKVSEEIFMDVCLRDSRWHVISLRYFNPIGAHPSGRLGELPLGVPNNLMPYITQTAAGVRPCLYIFGNDYNTPDGTAIRDYIHVVDLADAHLLALDRMLSGKQEAPYEVFNLGTGCGYSVLEVVQTFMRVNNVEIPYQIVSRRPGDVEQIWADPSLARQKLGWTARYTLEDMVRHAWQWEKFYRFEFQKQNS